MPWTPQLFKVLKIKKQFEWTTECAAAQKDLKRVPARPLIMSRPNPRELLLLYLVASSNAVSVVLVREEDKV